MKKIIYCILSLSALFTFAACDDGPIENVTNATTGGKVVKVEGTITGLRTWPSRYDISVAGFTADDANTTMPYATISKVVTTDENGHVSIVLSNIGSSVSDIEVCAMNTLRQKIVTFTSMDISNEPDNDTIRFDIGTIDASMLAGIQTGIFNASCAACHGANGRAAAGLNLTEGNAYESLVNHASTQLPDMFRVKPGDADSSVIWQVIDGNASENWPMNHADMLNKERAAGLLQMLEDWINNGARI